jgi:hypothetical protein
MSPNNLNNSLTANLKLGKKAFYTSSGAGRAVVWRARERKTCINVWYKLLANRR